MNRFRWKAPALLAVAALGMVGAASDPAAGAGQRRAAYAITGATVITAPGNTINDATVVIRDGLIESVGAGVTAPPDARIIDASGMTVYAGWIDAYATIAVAEEEGEATPAQGGRGGRGGQQQEERDLELGAPGVNDNVRSDFDVASNLDGEDTQISRLRDAGFTAALIVPEEGIYRGRSALIALRNAEPSEIVVRDNVAQAIGFQSGGFGRGYPSSLMGVITLIRQVLLDAQRAATWESSYQKGPSGIPRPERIEALAALQPVLAGNQRVIFDATNTRLAKRALNIAAEFSLQPVIKGNGNEYEMTETLAQAGAVVIVPVAFPEAPDALEGDEAINVDLAELQRWERAPGNAAALQAAGVPFAFSTDDLDSPADFLENIRQAVDAGLARDAALAALTTTPARLFGVDSILGTIAAGKIANLVVATGDPFTEESEIRYVFVDGVDYEVETEAGGGRGGRSGSDASSHSGRSGSGAGSHDGSVAGDADGATRRNQQGERQ